MTTQRVLHTATTLTLSALLWTVLPLAASAQGSGDRPTRVHSVRRLGGSSRLTPPVRTVDQLTRAFARPRTQRDVTTALRLGGLSALEVDVKKAISSGAVREVTVARGTDLQWMAYRRGATAAVLRPARWDGVKPFPAFEFVVDDLQETYTFVVPQECGNLTLVSREPSRERARRDADAAAEAARRASEARSLEEARRADDARKAEEARRAEEARKLEDARRAEEARLAEVARVEEARKAEELRQAEAARLAEERELSVRPFIAGFFGKQRRQYDENDPAGLGTAFLPGFCDPLFGGKVGIEKSLKNNWVFAPAVGFAFDTDESDRSSLFVDAEINKRFGNRAYVGTGVGLWDITHGDFITPTALLHFGLPLWKGDDQRTLFFVTEGRVMLRRASDLDSNYQFWGGLRFLFR